MNRKVLELIIESFDLSIDNMWRDKEEERETEREKEKKFYTIILVRQNES